MSIWPRKNKAYNGTLKASHWRRLSIGSWGRPNDPTIYGAIEINIEPALQYIEKLRAESNERITITHFIGKVWGLILKMHPEMNAEIRLGRFYQRKHITIAFQVAVEGGHSSELSMGTVHDIDQKSLPEIASILNQSAHRIRKQDDPDYKPIKKATGHVPGFLLYPIISLLKLVINTLNLWTPALGMPQDAFGSIMITNVGSLGLDWAFPALFPPANNAALVAIGAIYQEPVYDTDANNVVTQTRLERFIRMCGAFDHRYIDGLHASKIAHDMRKIFAHPEKYHV